MEISILLTILLMIISLGGLLLQEGRIWLIVGEQIEESVTIKYDLVKGLFYRAEKFVLRGLYLLNTVVVSDAQITTQTTLIQPQIIKSEG